MVVGVKNLPASTGHTRDVGSITGQFDPWVVKIPWRRKWQPTPVFLPGESHGQTSLAGYSPWGRKESGTTEHTYMDTASINIFFLFYAFIYLYLVVLSLPCCMGFSLVVTSRGYSVVAV